MSGAWSWRRDVAREQAKKTGPHVEYVMGYSKFVFPSSSDLDTLCRRLVELAKDRAAYEAVAVDYGPERFSHSQFANESTDYLTHIRDLLAAEEAVATDGGFVRREVDRFVEFCRGHFHDGSFQYLACFDVS